EDYLTAVSPGSSLVVIVSEIAREREGKIAERVLSVGDPSFDRSDFPELAPLYSAAREAKEVASFYSAALVLTGDAAIKSRIEIEVEKANVIHLATHSVFDPHSPLHSKLLLARQPTTSGSESHSNDALEAREIYRMKLKSTRLVVLSSCQSAVERYYRGEGMMSLVRP